MYSLPAYNALLAHDCDSYSALIADADKNKDGKVSPEEFLALVEHRFKGKSYEQIPSWYVNK